MNEIESFEEFFRNSSSLNFINIEIIPNLLIAVFLGFLVKKIYLRFGTSVSNRNDLGSQFISLIVITTFVISVVKSSLALSLGLVGALSIVRFRTAIKEPNELIYLFLCIAIGLGLGANLKILTVIATSIIFMGIFISRVKDHDASIQSEQILTLSSPIEVDFEKLVSALKKHTDSLTLIRFDVNEDGSEFNFNASFENYKKINSLKSDSFIKTNKISTTILDSRGII